MNNEEKIAEQKSLGPCLFGHSWRFRNPYTRACEECQRLNEERGRARKLKNGSLKKEPRRRSKPESGPYFRSYHDGRVNESGLADYLEALSDNPISVAVIEAEGRRPKGVTSARHGVAIRQAVREPMLNATPGAVSKALREFKNEGQRIALDSGIVKSFVVKPTSRVTGVHGWYERRWMAKNARYARGLVIVTDEGEQSKLFNSWGEARKAILASGWEILR